MAVNFIPKPSIIVFGTRALRSATVTARILTSGFISNSAPYWFLEHQNQTMFVHRRRVQCHACNCKALCANPHQVDHDPPARDQKTEFHSERTNLLVVFL